MSLIQTDRFEASRGDPDRDWSSLQESYAAVRSVPAARQAIVEFAAAAGACDERLEAIRLASSEALSNVVQHAYPGRRGRFTSPRDSSPVRTMPFCSARELAGLWVDAGLLDVETDEITATVEYDSFDDLWAPFAQGISPAGAYLTSLEREAAQALRRELFNRLGEPHQQFRLGAKAFSVRGHR